MTELFAEQQDYRGVLEILGYNLNEEENKDK